MFCYPISTVTHLVQFLVYVVAYLFILWGNFNSFEVEFKVVMDNCSAIHYLLLFLTEPCSSKFLVLREGLISTHILCRMKLSPECIHQFILHPLVEHRLGNDVAPDCRDRWNPSLLPSLTQSGGFWPQLSRHLIARVAFSIIPMAHMSGPCSSSEKVELLDSKSFMSLSEFKLIFFNTLLY